jgi:hypothetical protein
MAQAYHRSPSEILRLTDPLQAFYLDRAVFALAGRMQNELDALQQEPKAHLKLPIWKNRWGLGERGSTGFADPTKARRDY